MEIPVNVKAQCNNGHGGQVKRVIIHPIREMVTNIVVDQMDIGGFLFLVPVHLIAETTDDMVHLNCTRAELSAQDFFFHYEYLQGQRPFWDYAPDQYMMEPYALSELEAISREEMGIPANDLAIRRGTLIEATDGRVGQVDAFLVSPETHYTTHLILRQSQLWNQKEVAIPVSHIAQIRMNTVYLKVDRRSIGSLPLIPRNRKWF